MVYTKKQQEADDAWRAKHFKGELSRGDYKQYYVDQVTKRYEKMAGVSKKSKKTKPAAEPASINLNHLVRRKGQAVTPPAAAPAPAPAAPAAPKKPRPKSKKRAASPKRKKCTIEVRGYVVKK